jgi:TRAP-type mannitol/chloroaromatic compound transport system substrate-binding protein
MPPLSRTRVSGHRVRGRLGVWLVVLLVAMLTVACNGNGSPAVTDNGSPPDGDGDGATPADDDADNGDRVALQEGETYSWTVQSYTIAGTEPHGWVEDWAQRVSDLTDGQIQMEVHPGGALVGYADMREALTDGIIDIGLNAPAFFQGDDPAFGAWFSMPVLPIDRPALARYLAYQWGYEHGGLELARELYEPFDIHIIGFVTTPNEPVHSRVPIQSLEDFQGLRVRAAPGLVSNMFEAVGASPVAMPGGEIFTALDTGVIDATEFVGWTENRGLGIHEVTDYALFPGFHTPMAIVDVGIHIDTWSQLPERLQLILEDSILWLNRQVDHHTSYRDFETEQQMQDEDGIEVNTLPPEDVERIRQIGLEVTEQYAGESEMSERMVNSMLEFLRFVGELE